MVKTQILSILESQRGSMHVRCNLPNQDAIKGKRILYKNGEMGFLMALADGHGSPQHDLSKFGAEFAVDNAVKVLYDLITTNGGKSKDEQFEIIRSQAPTLIKDGWRRDIIKHSVCNGHEVNDMRYGTTLMFAVYIQGDLLAASLGDGNIVVSSEGENKYLWWDPDTLYSPFTNSMCQPDAVSEFKFEILSNVDKMIMATDGLINSIQDPEGVAMYMDYFINIMEDHEEDDDGNSFASKELITNLAKINLNPNIDDISVCITKFSRVALPIEDTHMFVNT